MLLAYLHMRLAEQAVPTGPFGDRDTIALQSGGQDGLGLAEPTPAAIHGPKSHQVGVQPGRVGVLDQPVGRRSQVLDLGIEVAFVTGGGLGRVGKQRGIVLGVALAGGLLVSRVAGSSSCML